MDKEFKNTASPSERARQFIEDQRRLRQPPQGTTYHQLQHVDIELEAQGRFAGTKPEMGPEYPRQPDTSPWSMQNLPEPTINAAEMFAVEACGEPHEVALAAEIEQARMVEAGGSVEAPLPTDPASHAAVSSSSAHHPATVDRGSGAIPPNVKDVLGRAIRRIDE
jgi:hypothetical protein